jgi:hypothetical protein
MVTKALKIENLFWQAVDTKSSLGGMLGNLLEAF